MKEIFLIEKACRVSRLKILKELYLEAEEAISSLFPYIDQRSKKELCACKLSGEPFVLVGKIGLHRRNFRNYWKALRVTFSVAGTRWRITEVQIKDESSPIQRRK